MATSITEIYQNELGRAPDAEGLDYWEGQLSSGAMTLDQIEQAINASGEGRLADPTQTVGVNSSTGQAITQADVDAYIAEQVANPTVTDDEKYAAIYEAAKAFGVSSESVAQGLQTVTGNQEFTPELVNTYVAETQSSPLRTAYTASDTTGMSQEAAEEFVRQQYATIGRTDIGTGVDQIDAEGFEYWTDRLTSGETSVEEVQNAFENVITNTLETDGQSKYSQYVGGEIQTEVDEHINQLIKSGLSGDDLYKRIVADASLYDVNNQYIANALNTVGGETGVTPDMVANYRMYGTTTNPTDTGTTAVIVYGPDGTMYSSPAAAIAAGVTNYTYTPPTDTGTTTGTVTDNSTNATLTTTGGISQLVAGTPQNDQQANIADYQGLQAINPTLTPQTDLSSQVQALEIQEDEIQQMPTLGAAPVIDYTAQTAQQVSAPTQYVTQTGTAAQTQAVAQPELATMEAATSEDKIAEAAKEYTAATQDLDEVDPRATVQGQLTALQEQFADGAIPSWAAGAYRNVTATMAARGLGASSLAGAAITQALMESTLPIATSDAAFYQELTKLNLSNTQQSELAKFNAQVTSIFNDTAAENAARNLNTQSENELNQFFANLAQQVAVSNTEQLNAMETFNAGAINQANQFYSELGVTVDKINADAANDMAQFNAEMTNQVAQFNASMANNREQFEISNQIAIDASNVQWRRDVNTANTAAMNAAIQVDVQNLLNIQNNALNNLWDQFSSLLDYSFTSQESALDRAAQLTMTVMSEEIRAKVAQDSSESSLIGDIFKGVATIVGSDTGQDILNNFFGNKNKV